MTWRVACAYSPHLFKYNSKEGLGGIQTEVVSGHLRDPWIRDVAGSRGWRGLCLRWTSPEGPGQSGRNVQGSPRVGPPGALQCPRSCPATTLPPPPHERLSSASLPSSRLGGHLCTCVCSPGPACLLQSEPEGPTSWVSFTRSPGRDHAGRWCSRRRGGWAAPWRRGGSAAVQAS